jgi:hypothetical protein
MWFAKDKESGEIDYLAEVKEFHRQFVEPYKGKPKGCQNFEIRALEKSFGFELPLAYKQYMAWMGKDKNGIFVGSDCFIWNVEDNTAWLPELLAENQISFNLPENYLCFFSHQGYIVSWFELPKRGDDPLTWFYQEGTMSEPVLEDKFTDFLLAHMKSFAKVLPRLYKRAT